MNAISAQTVHDLETPRLLLDVERMEANLTEMQAECDRHAVELWPHIKTHKLPAVAKRQLELGAKGLTCAKIGEAEAMLSSGVRRIFVAHSIVDPRSALRLAALAAALDELILAATSVAQVEALEKVLATVDLTLPVMLAVNTGLNREGGRSLEECRAIAEAVEAAPHLRLRGFYSHEGHTYRAAPEELDGVTDEVHRILKETRDAIAPELPIWPGCSVTALRMASRPAVQAVRPGAYVFGDLALCASSKVLPWDRATVTVLATVVDRPAPGLALIDAGSKTFSGDKSPNFGCSAWEVAGTGLQVTRCNEEHGYVEGAGVDDLKIGDRLRFVPAHICPVLNLADEVIAVRGEEIVGVWPVDGRGKNR